MKGELALHFNAPMRMPSRSVQNRRNFFELSSERRRARGERGARVTSDGLGAKKSRPNPYRA